MVLVAEPKLMSQVEIFLERGFGFRRRGRRAIITTPHATKAMIPAIREPGKKIAPVKATSSEPQPIASRFLFASSSK
jgi:hypothetical protein